MTDNRFAIRWAEEKTEPGRSHELMFVDATLEAGAWSFDDQGEWDCCWRSSPPTDLRLLVAQFGAAGYLNDSLQFEREYQVFARRGDKEKPYEMVQDGTRSAASAAANGPRILRVRFRRTGLRPAPYICSEAMAHA